MRNGKPKKTFIRKDNSNVWGLTTGKPRKNGEMGDAAYLKNIIKLYDQGFKTFNNDNREEKYHNGNDTDNEIILNFLYLEAYRRLNGRNASFVFIIDEINRGELSKIFGELFFSIDPGYRGEKGRVATQYQNLVEDGDAFKDGFYVPENVYIIGTMNDIDRSVESMDFAIRRRFAWCEVTAEDSANAMLGDENDNRREYMKRVNNALNKLGFSEAYHVGAAYFKDLNANDNQAVKDLWNYRLKSLLFEYLRGREDASTAIEDLESIYYTGKPKNEAEKGNNE